MDAAPHDMTVKEARMAQCELERTIGKLLEQFSAATGLRVTAVDLVIVETQDGQRYVYDVQVSASL